MVVAAILGEEVRGRLPCALTPAPPSFHPRSNRHWRRCPRSVGCRFSRGSSHFVGLVAAHVSASLVKALLAGPLGPALAATIGYVIASAIAVCFYLLAVRLVGTRQASDFEGPGWLRKLISGVVLGTLLMGVAVAWAFGAYTVIGFNPHSQAGRLRRDRGL